jgi:hypothetical protein
MGHPDIKRLLEQWEKGNREVFEALLAMVFDEFREFFRPLGVRERGHSRARLGDEAEIVFSRLVGEQRLMADDRLRFYSFVATGVRYALSIVEKEQRMLQRAVDDGKIVLEPYLGRARSARDRKGRSARDVPLFDYDGGLAELEVAYPREALVLELRYLLELTLAEIADLLEVPPDVVEMDLMRGKALLGSDVHRRPQAPTTN